MSRGLLQIFCMFVLAAALTAAPVVARSDTRIRAADNHPKGYPNVVAVENMGKKLEAATDGRINLTMFAGGVLGDEKEAILIPSSHNAVGRDHPVAAGGQDRRRCGLGPDDHGDHPWRNSFRRVHRHS